MHGFGATRGLRKQKQIRRKSTAVEPRAKRGDTMAQDGTNKQTQTPLRWSVYDDGLRIWSSERGQYIGTIPTRELKYILRDMARRLAELD